MIPYVLISAGMLGAVKAVGYLCTEQPNNDTRMNRIRNRCFQWQQQMVNWMGEENYQMLRSRVIPALCVLPLAIGMLNNGEAVSFAVKRIFDDSIHVLYEAALRLV